MQHLPVCSIVPRLQSNHSRSHGGQLLPEICHHLQGHDSACPLRTKPQASAALITDEACAARALADRFAITAARSTAAQASLTEADPTLDRSHAEEVLLLLQYAFNLFSHNSPMGENGYNEEETKMIRETHKIWGEDDIAITATCIRVPIMRAHAESINLEFEKAITEEEVQPGSVVHGMMVSWDAITHQAAGHVFGSEGVMPGIRVQQSGIPARSLLSLDVNVAVCQAEHTASSLLLFLHMPCSTGTDKQCWNTATSHLAHLKAVLTAGCCRRSRHCQLPMALRSSTIAPTIGFLLL